MKLDPSKYSTDPAYIRLLVKKAGTQAQAAEYLGIAERTVKAWIGGESKWPPYAQYALECLVKYGVAKK